MHKNLICHYSTLFRAAFDNANSIEGHTQTIDFKDSTGQVFGMFAEWLYTQDLKHLYSLYPQDESISTEDEFKWVLARLAVKTERMHALIQLWLLGDLVLAPSLQNMVIVAMEGCHSDYSPLGNPVIYSKSLDMAYSRTSPGSVLREYLVHNCFLRWGGDRLAGMLSLLPNEMIREGIVALEIHSAIGWPYVEEVEGSFDMSRYFVRGELMG